MDTQSGKCKFSDAISNIYQFYRTTWIIITSVLIPVLYIFLYEIVIYCMFLL